MSFAVSQKTKESCRFVPISGAADFQFFNVRMLRRIKYEKALGFGVWFCNDTVNNDAGFYEYIGANEFSPEKLQRMAELAGKYNDFRLCLRKDQAAALGAIVKTRERLLHKSELVYGGLTNSGNLGGDLRSAFTSFVATLKGANQPAVIETVESAISMLSERPTVSKIMDSIRNTQGNQFIFSAVAGATVSAIVAKEAGVDSRIASIVALGALLRDIGHYHLEEWLTEPDRILSPREERAFRTHTAKGANIIENIVQTSERLPTEIAVICIQHHEWFNGMGYPNQLRGAQERFGKDGIHLFARIVAIGDLFAETMLTHNSLGAAIIKMKNHYGQLDNDLVKPLISAVSKQGDGDAK